jgi:hypothetical protein
MSNEINLLQVLYKHLEYLFISLIKVRIIKFIQCGPWSTNGPNFLEISLFEPLYITIGHLILITHEQFIYISS